MKNFKKKKDNFKKDAILKETQMNSDELNLFDDKKPQETTPAIEQPQDDENPQLDNMPLDSNLDLNTGGDTLPDTLVEVDIDGDIYEAKMNKGDKSITLTLKNKDESAGEKMNIADNNVPPTDLNNQNIDNSMETPDMKIENINDPFKKKDIIFEGADGEDDFFDEETTDNTPAEPTDDIPSENPADELPAEEIPAETPAEETPAEITDIDLGDSVEETAAEKIGQVIEDVIEDKVEEALGEDTPESDSEPWDDDEFDDFEWDDDDVDTVEVPADSETPEVETEPELGSEEKPLLDMESTDQEEPGLNNVSKAMAEIKRLKSEKEKSDRALSALIKENKQFKETFQDIQLFTEKVNAVSEIDKLVNIAAQDKMNMKNLIQQCNNSVEIKTVLNTIGMLKESMSKKFSNVKDILKEHNISPKLQEIVDTIRNNNPEIIKEQTERDRMADLAGV